LRKAQALKINYSSLQPKNVDALYSSEN